MLLLALLALAAGQQIGTNKQEVHLPFPVQHCSKGGGCQTVQKSLVLDANWRWCSIKGTYHNCFTDGMWNTKECPDPATCAQNCALEGVTQKDWSETYGISVKGDALTLGYVAPSGDVGSRVYLLDDEEHYTMFKLLNQEFQVTVDASHLVCGLNGALYMTEMSADGGMEKYPTNKCGAKYGTGYCDAQCPRDIKWIQGEANVKGWTNITGVGDWGTCCHEMDIWEANMHSEALTPHPCDHDGEYKCTGPKECGDVGPTRYSGVCDKDGCDYAPYRLGDTGFFGPGSTFKVDTTKPITLITQWITDDNTPTGTLSEIRRKYVQDGKEIANSKVTVNGNSYDSITEEFCKDRQVEFKDPPSFIPHGGLKAVGGALGRGMVLVMSLWDDSYAHMLWLDSKFPVNGTGPGVMRGTCPTTSGVPAQVRKQHPNSPVTFSNVKYGDIGTTYP